MSADIALDDIRLCHRQVHRAASDLRRGVPVLLVGHESLLIIAAETASDTTLAEMEAASGSYPMLVLAPARAAAILRTPLPSELEAVGVTLPPSVRGIRIYQALADPTAPQPAVQDVVREAIAPPLSHAAIALAKITRLLPAVLVSPLPAGVTSKIIEQKFLAVNAVDVLGYASSEMAGLRQVATANVPLKQAPDSRVIAFRSHGSPLEHLAIVIGSPESHDAPLVRLHSECFTGDLLGSMRCDCGEQLRGAIGRMAEDGAGILLYLAQEGRGIGLVNKLRAYGLQDRGLDTMDANRALGWGADERNFLVGATMLRLMGIGRVRLLTNNPDKLVSLAACGIDVVGREPHLFAPNGVNDEYLATKAGRFGHMFD